MEEDKQVPGCSFVMTANISLTKSSQLAKAWKIWMYNGTTKKEKARANENLAIFLYLFLIIHISSIYKIHSFHLKVFESHTLFAIRIKFQDLLGITLMPFHAEIQADETIIYSILIS